MELYILNTNLDVIALIDTYQSNIWTDRYWAYGDFELYTPMNQSLMEYIKKGNYIRCQESDHVMIIEDIRITSDSEDGNFLTVTGRSLESILTRRIVWGLRTYNGNLQNGIQALLNENVINPSIAERKIPNFIFKPSTDSRITSLTIDSQWTGDNLYNIINGICKAYDLGFKVTLNDSKQFVFELYMGEDRSYEQSKNPFVIFSPNFENIINSNYYESDATLKNVTLIGGEGEGNERRYTSLGTASGLTRRELFTDARDISSDLENDQKMTEAQYNQVLQYRGLENLMEYQDVVSFEGQVETSIMFKYEEDFWNGDVVQIADDYGHENRARILEIVFSHDRNGQGIYPTFQMIDSGED